MSIASCHIITFSPTGSTRKIAEAVASGTGLPIKLSDLTLPQDRDQTPVINEDELTILAVPVYYGRVAKTAAKAIAKLRGQGKPAILLVNYGNRHYDDALIELFYLARGSFFSPVAAGAFVSEHSYSTEEFPIAEGRPDTQDIVEATAFGAQIAEKMTSGFKPLKTLPGTTPYKEYPQMQRAPVTLDNCTLCGTCVAACPVAAITIVDKRLETDAESCIICQACVKVCPEDARVDTEPGARESRERLSGITRERRSPETFFRE